MPHLHRTMPCLLLLATLTAAASPGSSGAALDAIELEGNTRTAREVVVRALGVRPGDRIDDESIPEPRRLHARRSPGFARRLTGGLWAERAVTATLDYELPIWRPSWGTATTLAFVDAGVRPGAAR